MVTPPTFSTARKLKIVVRIVGAALVAFAAILFVFDAVRSMQSEEHSTPDGFVIQHRIEITRTTFAVGIAGSALLALSFIRHRNAA